MARASLTRRVSFKAKHRYWNARLGKAENVRLYGAAAAKSYHSHTYICDVTVAGRINPSGMIVDLAELDSLLRTEIRDRFHNRTINVDVPEFRDGRLAPSGENIARFVFERLRDRLAGTVVLSEVAVAEDETLRVSYRG